MVQSDGAWRLPGIVFALFLRHPVMQSLSAVVFAMQDRLRAGPTSWGICCLFDMVFVFALQGAVPVVGGCSDPIGTTVRFISAGPFFSFCWVLCSPAMFFSLFFFLSLSGETESL